MMARDESKERRGGFSFGLSTVQAQLQRLQEETVNLGTKLLDDATGAFGDGQRLVGGLLDQLVGLGDEVQQRILATGREAEQGIERVLTNIEGEIARRTDGITHRLTQTLRREQDKLRDRQRALETRVGEIARQTGRDAYEELQSGLTGVRSTVEQLLATLRQGADGGEETRQRMQQVERQVAELARENAREVIDGDEFRHKLSRLEHWISDLSRDTGAKQGEQTALRERLTRLETRFVNTTKDDAARAASGAGAKERQSRLEARVGDLTKELLARSIDLSNLKERLAHLEALASEALRADAIGDGEPSHRALER
jgi:DNA repair exonuclease SbcCD ATPase subunit